MRFALVRHCIYSSLLPQGGDLMDYGRALLVTSNYVCCSLKETIVIHCTNEPQCCQLQSNVSNSFVKLLVACAFLII